MAAVLASPASDAAAVLIQSLYSRGVRHFVLSPGSRSQALALALAAFVRTHDAFLHVRIDERVAGFTAIGIARETRMPAAVICTSGTAVANLMPAMLEAHHSGVPLLLLTADRPPELRGVGANQTTRQPAFFAPHTRFDADVAVPEEPDPEGTSPASCALRELAGTAVDAALGNTLGPWAEGALSDSSGEADSGFDAFTAIPLRPAGPVHLNLPYREPLTGPLPAWFTATAGEAPREPDGAGEGDPGSDKSVGSGALYQGGGGIGGASTLTYGGEEPFELERGPRTIVIAGSGAHAEACHDAERVAFEGRWPLIAEIVSGARFGRAIVHGYRDVLRQLGDDVERVVVWGHPTLSREVAALLSRPEIDVIAVRGPGEYLNLNGNTRTVGDVVVSHGADGHGADGHDAEELHARERAWMTAWMRASRAATVDVAPPAPDAEALSSAEPRERTRAMAAELEVIRTPIDRATLVDAVWRATWPHDRLMFGSSRLVRVADAVLAGKKVPVHANRGLAGIDGTIATATGIAVARQHEGGVGITRVVLGDVAFLHDVGALLVPEDETPQRLQIIVGNDGGGTIFDELEVAGVADPQAMARVMYTPQSAQLEALATAYGWSYARATTRAELDQALTTPVTGPQIVEVPLAR